MSLCSVNVIQLLLMIFKKKNFNNNTKYIKH